MNQLKATLVLGASTNPERYAYLATQKLRSQGHPVTLVGNKPGFLDNLEIHTEIPQNVKIDTVTLYIGPNNQANWHDEIIRLAPKRIVFNPGTENPTLRNLAQKNEIETIDACTLVMLSLGNY